MDAENHKYQINYLKGRYEYLDLNDLQAEQIYRHENNNKNISFKSFLTDWEELDFDLTVFRNILDDNQFILFEREQDRRRLSLADSLKDQDNRDLRELRSRREKTNFLKNVFVPEMIALRETEMLNAYSDQSKIEYLKQQYKILLQDFITAGNAEHFRHNRIYRPNEFESQQQLYYSYRLWPKSYLFDSSTDEVNKLLYEQVMFKLVAYTKKRREIFDIKQKELHDFDTALFEKHYKGWQEEGFIMIDLKADDPEKVFGAFMMAAVLADPPFYSE